ncbi:MAG: hypothetical protein KAX31_01065, partial [Thermoplasmata archaeon]|nr:hypothetical protein [Thermoplasmata archaeon]
MTNIADALKMRAHTYTLALRKVLKLLRSSKPGMAGLIIIMIFVVMAVFAPIIAPFGVDFIAPADDMFSVERIEKHYPSAEGFHPLVIGPTTPSESAMDGGMWFILANADGTIYMDFAVKSFDEPPTPFEDGNRTITLSIQDLNLEPPLSEVLFVAPGRGYNRTTDVTPTFGERVESGLLAFVANTTFVLLDPFVPRVLYLEDIGFMPDWFVEDTASAGDMLGPPSQKKIDFPFPMTHGPYRYIALATEDRVIAYEFEYLWNSRGIRNLHMLVDYDVDVTQEPLLYLFDNVKYTANVSGLYVPSTNGTLYHFRASTNGAPDSIINFTIDGQTAEFTAPIGFMRSSDAFPRLYLSLARENSYSYQIFDPLSLEVIGEFSAEENARIE